MADHGFDVDFVQDNHSVSARAGTLRGLHYQAPPHAQAKLARCGRGALLDVAVDWRAGSPAFGQWIAVELSAANGRQLFLPEGILHGFVTRAPDTEIVYKCSAAYAPEADGAIKWDDPAFGIDWALDGPPVVSARDAAAPLSADMPTPFRFAA